jgi:hypothetical protein
MLIGRLSCFLGSEVCQRRLHFKITLLRREWFVRTFIVQFMLILNLNAAS